MENTRRLSPAFSIEHVAGASSSGIRHGKLVFTHVPQWAPRFTACAARGFGLPRTGWRTPQRILTRHLVTDSFTSKLQSPSGTWSSRWRRSKGATLSALSARCLSSRRSFDDYPVLLTLGLVLLIPYVYPQRTASHFIPIVITTIGVGGPLFRVTA